MHDNEKTTDQLPSLDEVIKAHYKPGTVYNPQLKLKPIIFETANVGVKQLEVSVVSIQSDAKKALDMINNAVLDKDK